MWLILAFSVVLLLRFQSTHPRRVWLIFQLLYSMMLLFQSTHPRRVWRNIDYLRPTDNMFQSTHPRRVWQVSALRSALALQFQSTHPRRVWHASANASYLGKLGFNPHTHEGCDVSSSVALQKSQEFQSTHPRRVWRYIRSKDFKPYGVSIHTPTKGVTLLMMISCLLVACFNPHTHEGCDIADGKYTLKQTVSIHTPTKGVTLNAINIFWFVC